MGRIGGVGSPDCPSRPEIHFRSPERPLSFEKDRILLETLYREATEFLSLADPYVEDFELLAGFLPEDAKREVNLLADLPPRTLPPLSLAPWRPRSSS
jgi:hypothetical protein